MQIEIKLDENCKEPKIIVVTNKMTDEINEIMKRLSDEQPKMIAGFKDDIVEVLEPFDIYRIFAAAGKVFAETNHGEYTLRLRQRCGRGCEKRYCGCRTAGHCGDNAGRGACREGTRHPGPCRTLSWEAFSTGSACSLWLLPGAVSVRYGPVRLKKRPSP